MNFTDEQNKIIHSNGRYNIANCCAGSGKSTVLAERAKRLYREFNEPVLVCTFSNEAVTSLSKKIGPEFQPHIKIQTIHSLAYNIVKDYWKVLGEIIGGHDWLPEPKIVCKEDEINLMLELFPTRDAEQTYETFFNLRKFCIDSSDLLRMYNKGIYFGKTSRTDMENFNSYEKNRLSRGLINFEDMIDLANILMPLPEVSVPMSRKFSHILIDEAQDTSKSQWSIIRPLVAHAKTTLAAADRNQSIYSFRNADGSVLTDLGYLQNSTVFNMSESFRSGEEICDFANQVVTDKKTKIKTKHKKSSVLVKQFDKKEQEIEWVLKNLDKNTAVLSRTNAYLIDFELACIKANISYRGQGLFRSPHIKTLSEFVSSYTGSDVLGMIEQAFMQNSKYTNIEKDDIKVITKIITTETSKGFLNLVNKSVSMNNEGVSITTCHSSKGLEYNKVYLVGAHEKHMPHRLSSNLEEESNLFYVGVTRARENLNISYVGSDASRFIPAEFL